MASHIKPAGADTSYWIKFFTECGIPPSESTNYAITFTDNRIQKDMLMDLTKEYLTEMGITVLGDVISILKHAKTIHTQLAREKALQGTKNISATPRRQTAASRTVNHYLSKYSDTAPMNLPMVPKLSKELTARLGGSPPVEETGFKASKITLSQKLEEVVPVPKKRRVFPEHEGKYKITMPSGKTQKTKKILAKSMTSTSVFDRLGQETRQTTVTESGLIISSPTESSVFSRLGGKKALKREATSTSMELESDEEENGQQLEYAGIFKDATSSPAKKPKLTVQRKTITIQKQVKKVKVPATKQLVQTAGILSESSGGQFSKKISERLGKKTSISEVTSTTDEPVTTKSGTFSRLGPKKIQTASRLGLKKLPTAPRLGPKKVQTAVKKQTNVAGVFGRLGKQVSSST